MIYYAIGDVHGMYDMLDTLLNHIHDKNDEQATIVFLGDYVDRGPDSAKVIKRLMNCKDNDQYKYVVLAGNHEDLMINAYNDATPDNVGIWRINGGEQTLDSYGITGSLKELPKEDMDFLKSLPFYHHDKENNLFFVHAGVDINTFPEVKRSVATWTRSHLFFDDQFWFMPQLKDMTFIHGHTPLSETPIVTKHRINLDTGACFRDMGNLSAVRIDTDTRAIKFMRVDQQLNMMEF